MRNRVEGGAGVGAHPIPGIPDRWQQFGLCMLFDLLVPCMPLAVEIPILGHVEAKTFFLFLAVFPITIGVSSRSQLMFGATVVICLGYSVIFGLASNGVRFGPLCFTFGDWCFIVVVVLHAAERYNYHVAEGRAYWKFNQEGSRP